MSSERATETFINYINNNPTLRRYWDETTEWYYELERGGENWGKRPLDEDHKALVVDDIATILLNEVVELFDSIFEAARGAGLHFHVDWDAVDMAQEIGGVDAVDYEEVARVLIEKYESEGNEYGKDAK